MKIMLLATLLALSFIVGQANAQQSVVIAAYHAPAYNFYQNNWMSNSD